MIQAYEPRVAYAWYTFQEVYQLKFQGSQVLNFEAVLACASVVLPSQNKAAFIALPNSLWIAIQCRYCSSQ